MCTYVSEENSIYLVLAIGCAIVVIGGYNRGDSIGVRSPMLRAWRFGFGWVLVGWWFDWLLGGVWLMMSMMGEQNNVFTGKR